MLTRHSARLIERFALWTSFWKDQTQKSKNMKKRHSLKMMKLRDKHFFFDWANFREKDKSVWFSVRSRSRTRNSSNKNSIEFLQCLLLLYEERLQSTLWKRPHSSRHIIQSQQQLLMHLEQPQPPPWTAQWWEMSLKQLLYQSFSQLPCFWLKD